MNALPTIVFIIFCIAFSLFVILLAGCGIIALRNRRKLQNVIGHTTT